MLINECSIDLQVTELQCDRVKMATVTIQKVLDNPDKETAEFIQAAQDEYESEYQISFSSTFACETFSAHILVHNFEYIFFLFPELPASKKLYNLTALLNFDVSKVSGEVVRAEAVCKNQILL